MSGSRVWATQPYRLCQAELFLGVRLVAILVLTYVLTFWRKVLTFWEKYRLFNLYGEGIKTNSMLLLQMMILTVCYRYFFRKRWSWRAWKIYSNVTLASKNDTHIVALCITNIFSKKGLEEVEKEMIPMWEWCWKSCLVCYIYLIRKRWCGRVLKKSIPR